MRLQLFLSLLHDQYECKKFEFTEMDQIVKNNVKRYDLSPIALPVLHTARIAVCNTWNSGGTALCRVGGATSQLDLPSLTPLSVAGCG